MKTITKKLELQIDEKPNGYVLRLNDQKSCILRICQIPKDLMESGGFIDIVYPKTKLFENGDTDKSDAYLTAILMNTLHTDFDGNITYKRGVLSNIRIALGEEKYNYFVNFFK